MNDTKAQLLTGSRLSGGNAQLRQAALTAAEDAWNATSLLGESQLQKPTAELRDQSLEAARAAWTTRETLRTHVLAAAEATWESIPYETAPPIRILSDEEWAAERTPKPVERRSFRVHIAIPAVAALLLVGFYTASGIFANFKTRIAQVQSASAASITMITEQQPMLAMIALAVRDGISDSDDRNNTDHYAVWLDQESSRRP